MKPSQNLLSWQVFVATCRTRSISQAAVLLDIDLPKASRLLSALETELGEPLFDKSHRPIQPTPRAAELQRAVEPLVAGFQAALEPKAEPHERFTIRFAAPIELAQEYFSDKLFQYSELFHDVEFAVLPEVGRHSSRGCRCCGIEPSSRRSFRSDHSQLQQFDHVSISYAGISETARYAALAGGSQNARRASA